MLRNTLKVADIVGYMLWLANGKLRRLVWLKKHGAWSDVATEPPSVRLETCLSAVLQSFENGPAPLIGKNCITKKRILFHCRARGATG